MDPLTDLRRDKARMNEAIARQGMDEMDDARPRIPSEIDRLTMALDQLGSALETLESRLSPVLYEYAADDVEKPGEAMDDSHSHVAERITRTRWHAEALTVVVQRLIQRLEV